MGMDVYGKKPTTEEGQYFRNSVGEVAAGRRSSDQAKIRKIGDISLRHRGAWAGCSEGTLGAGESSQTVLDFCKGSVMTKLSGRAPQKVRNAIGRCCFYLVSPRRPSWPRLTGE